MKIIDVRSKLPVRGSNGKMKPSSVSICVIHHDGENRPLMYNSLKRYQKEAAYHISKGWNRISYHFSIDNVGDIYWLNSLDEILYHCGNLAINKKSLAIKFDGNMQTQQLTEAQKRAYKELMTYLTTKRPDLPKIIKGSEKPHREIKATACPGVNVTNSIIHTF